MEDTVLENVHEERWLLNEKYNGEYSDEYHDDLERLRGGEPLAYVIGWIPFINVVIHLDSRPLIPRVETEYWVTMALSEMVSRAPKGARILDLCAGSGCIGIATLSALSDVTVDFVEIEEYLHKTIWNNIAKNDIAPERARVLGGDLFEHIDEKYDCILCNPPYIDPEKSARVEEHVMRFEPHNALFGGYAGLSYISRILNLTMQYLSPRGVLYIEHEPEQAKAIIAQARDVGFRNIRVIRDQYDTERVTKLTRA